MSQTVYTVAGDDSCRPEPGALSPPVLTPFEMMMLTRYDSISSFVVEERWWLHGQ
jgi:hypothetical protein